MQSVADQVSEVEKIFKWHQFRGDAVPDFRAVRWEALCNTKRGGVSIHVERLRQAAAELNEVAA